MKKILDLLVPPAFKIVINKISRFSKTSQVGQVNGDASRQDLGIYWTNDMAQQLENWGKDHTWNEIECLLVNCEGKVLDIACGTGVNIKSISRLPFIEVYGFDISDLLLERARQKGIDSKYLKVCDATKTDYADNEFNYSYSIGSLEHFTEDGIDLFLKECHRYTSQGAFHMIPVSENNLDNGWITRGQSYFNNSLSWWLPKFEKYFSNVYMINSGWRDTGVSVGKWFVCFK